MIKEKKTRRYQRIIIGLSLILSLISACYPASSIEKEIENNPEPEPTTTPVVSAETEEIIDTPIQVIDVSEWIVAVGGLECTLEPYENKFLGWYMTDCPEQLWLPIGQTTQVNISEDSCTMKPIGDFEIEIQDLSSDAMIVEFIQMDDGDWGCQIPYSDISGIEVVCGFGVKCDGNNDGIKVIIKGKTIREYSGGSSSGNGDNAGNGRNQSVPPPPPPPDPE